jgi:predicted TIM-barrel fold metal-dependent hydrolase
MENLDNKRRKALKAIGMLSAAATGFAEMGCAPAQVKWSLGTDTPTYALPELLTDCHHHIYDSRYPLAPNASLRPKDALVDDYRVLQKRLGIKRHVLIQPSTYGIDNRLLVDSIAAFGLATTRGIAVVNTQVTHAELKRLHDAGVRGIRFNLAPPGTTTLDMVIPLAKRIAPLGWHIEVNAPAQDLLSAKATWSNLPCPVLFDHLGRVPEPNALNHPTFAMIRELLQQGKAWVKLSGFYNESKVGAPSYSDSVEVATAYAKEAPERVVWGSDWPHPTEAYDNKPNDTTLLNLIKVCVPDERKRNLLLVENPAKLYQFV